MFAFVVILTTVTLLASLSLARDTSTESQYTVWSSVIFQRTGERTPEIISDGTDAIVLTSVGANQAYANGRWFRQRYIDSSLDANRTCFNGAGGCGAPLAGLNPDIYNTYQTYAMSLDQQWNVATAQAWFQGFYPPFSPSSNGSTAVLDGVDLLANNTYVVGPMNGYQYVHVHTAGGLDPNFISLGGNYDCPAFAQAARAYTDTPQFGITQEEFEGLYDAVGSAVLDGIIPQGAWDYWNAYAIYDYLLYENAHNSTVAKALSRYHVVNSGANTTYLEILGRLASQQQYAQLGNLSAYNALTDSRSLPGVIGSISTIAGNTLAARILTALQDGIPSSQDSSSSTTVKLTILFADFLPLLSFFALTALPSLNPTFSSIPLYGSTAVFELFSYTNSSSSSSSSSSSPPSPSDLWVRFYFRNGTILDHHHNSTSSSTDSDPNAGFTSYPLFDRSPDATDMRWSDFQYSMMNLAIPDPSAWCTQCGAENLFCQAYNNSEAARSSSWTAASSSSNDDGSQRLDPVVAGTIGAMVALGVAAVVFGAVMLLGGVRMYRKEGGGGGRRRGRLGGFKGGAKMRSDEDLTIPKGGAAVVVDGGAVSSKGGHERVGSWELKNAEAGPGFGDVSAHRASMVKDGEEETDEMEEGAKPVKSRDMV